MSHQQVAEFPERTPALNLDVFRTVLHSCAVADLLRIGYASRLLRKEAIKELLSRPVFLEGNIQIESFCNLMLTGDPSHFSYLHTLVINHIPYITSDATHMLLEVFNRATGLRKLYLRRCEALFTKLDRRFAEAIAQLQHLDFLQIWIGTESHKYVRPMVLQLRSALKTLDCDVDPLNEFGGYFPDEVAHRQPHLTKLRICYPNLRETWKPYLSVRVLSIGIGDQTINLQRLCETFPNVRELSIQARVFEVDLANPSGEMIATRNAAIAFQNSGGGWKSLDYLYGTVGDLYTLCLTCPVRRVGVGHYDFLMHDGHRDVFSRTRPRRVDMTITCTPWFQSPISANPSLFTYGMESAEPGAVSHMCLDVAVSEDPVSTRQLIETITPFLPTCQLEYLHVSIGMFFIKEEDDYLHNMLPPVPPSLQESMANIDIAELVSALATSGPTLQTIVLSPVSRERTVWTVDRGDGRQILRRLDPYTASQVVEREEK